MSQINGLIWQQVECIGRITWDDKVAGSTVIFLSSLQTACDTRGRVPGEHIAHG